MTVDSPGQPLDRDRRGWPPAASSSAPTPDSAADEVIDDAGFLTEPPVDALAQTLQKTLDGQHPPVDPVKRAQRYGWDTVADRADAAHRAAIDGTW